MADIKPHADEESALRCQAEETPGPDRAVDRLAGPIPGGAVGRAVLRPHRVLPEICYILGYNRSSADPILSECSPEVRCGCHPHRDVHPHCVPYGAAEEAVGQGVQLKHCPNQPLLNQQNGPAGDQQGLSDRPV